MNHLKKTINTILITLLVLNVACTNSKKQAEDKEEQMEQSSPKPITYDTNDPKSIIKAVEMTNGSWNKLWEQKDVQFDYSYKQADGKEDISVERYVFDTEQSWANYTKHEVNVMPDSEGEVMQYYDGESTVVMQDDNKIDNPEVIATAKFLRKANYFWFVMMFKLDNPGTSYEYMGAENVENVAYDKVKVTYNPEVTGKEKNDTYILYVNPETKMVDQFYFSLPFMGMMEPQILMTVEYKEINGLQIPVTRNIFMPSESGYGDTPNLVESTTNVKFNNGFTEKSIKSM